MQLNKFLKERRFRIDPETTELGTFKRLPDRRGRPITQEELAECIGVSRTWYAMLESQTPVRTSAALLDRLASALMLSAEDRASLFNLALPELKLDTAARAPTAAPLYGATLRSTADVERVADTMARLRENYLTNGSTSDSAARPRIVKSWNRCREMGVDPDTKAATFSRDIDQRIVANEKFLSAVDPVISYLTDEFAQTGFIIVLTDADGKVLQMAGDLHLKRQLWRADIGTGSDISEAAYGTNAVGTAIADRRSIQMLGSEHFCEGPIGLTCTAAPIFTPGDCELAGVINVSANYKLAHPRLLGMIMHAALEIEERLAVL
jgi:transcriptional regulator with XRE-family HTH domain